MLQVNAYDQSVVARLRDFFGAQTSWQRSLWITSTPLALREALEAAEAVQSGFLSEASLNQVLASTLATVGPDPGVGSNQRRDTLRRILQSSLRFNGAEFQQLKLLISDIERDYLTNWVTALRGTNPPKAERAARLLAAFMLDAGFSSPYLHRWLTYRLKYEPGTRTLSDFMDDARGIHAGPATVHRVLVAFEAAAEGRSGMPANWVPANEVSSWLVRNHFEVTGVRQNGGMWFEVEARDAWAAVEKAVEIVDRLASRVSLGTDGKLTPWRRAWVEGHSHPYRFSIGPRRVEVHALHREDQLYTLHRGGIVDAALEILAPLNTGSQSTAVTGAWAAMEALLSGPGEADVLASDRMASLVACSFIRAELTDLSYQLEKQGGALAQQLDAAVTNRQRASITATALENNPTLIFGTASDHAAIGRIRKTLQDPRTRLRDIESHVVVTLRRLYRQRNLILHGGKTNAVALNTCLRTSAPLIGAGMDRIAHAWFVDGVHPVELAAKARIGIDLVDEPGARSVVDLLE